MRINNTEYNTDIYKILDKLRQELRQSGSRLLEKEPRESGEYLIIQCPYHKNGQERHPSAQLRCSDGLFYCHGCKEAHSLTDFLTYCLNEDGRDWLINRFGAVDISERKIEFGLENRNEVKKIEYLDKDILAKYRRTHPYMFTRKLDMETIRKFDIGYDPDFILETRDHDGKIISTKDIGECITFPNKDENGNILFIARRAIHTKFFNYPSDVDKPVYGLYEINREIRHGNDIREVYVVESMLDALVIWCWGKYAVALNGTGSAHQYDILKRTDIRSFILAFDNDNAGKVARKKFRQNIKNKFIQELSYKSYGNCKDINDMTKEQFLNAEIISFVKE